MDPAVVLGKATSRLAQVFEEREHRSVHFFADSRGRWHCLFLTFRDIAGEPSTGKHHWEHGSHLHYISHLFDPKLTKQDMWTALDERRHTLPAVHIRFDETPVPKDPGGRFVLDEQRGLATKVRVAPGAIPEPTAGADITDPSDGLQRHRRLWPAKVAASQDVRPTPFPTGWPTITNSSPRRSAGLARSREP
jgi:hypothetical protein